MMGPETLGHTRDVAGAFEIIFKLHKLLQWAKIDYRTWFKQQILLWAKETVGEKPAK